MWKKLDDAVGEQPEFASRRMGETPEMTLESASETLVEAYRNRQAEKAKFGVGAQKVLADQPLPPTTMATYTEAVNEFTKNANAFIEQLPLLKKARDSYEQAMRASAELRKILDVGEQHLQTLMNQLEQVVNPAPEKRKPEPSKVEAIRGLDESAGGVKRAL
jgi:exonuclease VII small subunit